MRVLRAVLTGAAAGTVATAAMSAVMLALRDRVGQQPPHAIAERAAQATGTDPSEGELDALAVLAHVGFGAGVGAAYALLPRTGAPALRGVVTAMAVYALSYLGWVPALGVLPPADRDRPGRVQVMVGAHVVYGAVLGAVEDRLR